MVYNQDDETAGKTNTIDAGTAYIDYANNPTDVTNTLQNPSEIPSGYTFRGWTDKDTALPLDSVIDANVTLNKDKTYYATYQKTITLTFRWNAQSDTANTPTVCMNYKTDKDYTYDINLPNTDIEGWTCRGWSKSEAPDADDANTEFTDKPVDDTTYNASYTRQVKAEKNYWDGNATQTVDTEAEPAYMNYNNLITDAQITLDKVDTPADWDKNRG